MTTETVKPRIYVACLASYNAGRLHGVWIDCEGKSAEELDEEVQAMLKESREPVAEEWAIHDSEGFQGWKHGEYESLETVADVVAAITEHGDAFTAALSVTDDLTEAERYLEENYQGSFDSLEDWADDYIQETEAYGTASEFMQRYFDRDAFLRDLQCGGEICDARVNGKVHVFWDM